LLELWYKNQLLTARDPTSEPPGPMTSRKRGPHKE
jgi:hypothetical protein